MTMIGQDNRVLAAIERYRAAIASGQKIDGSGPITDDLDALDKAQVLTFREWYAYQSAQASAHAMGKITADEAQTIYHALGAEGFTETGWAEDADLATKLVVTNVMGSLLGVR